MTKKRTIFFLRQKKPRVLLQIVLSNTCRKIRAILNYNYIHVLYTKGRQKCLTAKECNPPFFLAKHFFKKKLSLNSCTIFWGCTVHTLHSTYTAIIFEIWVCGNAKIQWVSTFWTTSLCLVCTICEIIVYFWKSIKVYMYIIMREILTSDDICVTLVEFVFDVHY